ncbi:hypothetical protein PVT71_29080 (plasmid) [Salipiger sp. H15]|uniref:Uncharacterized protein n=1 Tax=Alloyangia sp. H15 TaxID=3029062 RepID=A0AAU8AS86_9RHOB
MALFSSEQGKTIECLLERGLSDFEIARRVCPEGEDPELLLEAVALRRERQERCDSV